MEHEFHHGIGSWNMRICYIQFMENFPQNNLPEQPEPEDTRWEEMEELGLTSTEWEVMNLLRQASNLDDPTELKQLQQEIRDIVQAEYAEFGQGNLDQMIDQDAEYKFQDALQKEREKR